MTTLDCRILLAEDCTDTQRLISHMLRKAGAEVIVAADGQAAVQCVVDAEAEGRPFDLILMDMQMPILDGFSATRRLRQEGHRGPIVAFTALAASGDREACIGAGCDEYLTKPVERERLLGVISSFAKKRQPGGKLSA
jgi:Amt family ammonium transporter